MIVSAALGQHIIPEIQAGPQLDSVYVFCDNRSIHEQWARTISKVKGVYTEIEPICKALQIDCGRCDQGLIPISFRGIDPLFMYTQLLKETFLEIDDGDDDKSVKELIHYCRQQGDIKKDNIDKMGEYSKALSWYERSLEIYKIAFPANHPQLAILYVNTGVIYYTMGEYSKALSSHETALAINEKMLPPNHPTLASSYSNIGVILNQMGEYSKALSYYERSLELRKIALPPNHPDMAYSYNNIASAYKYIGEYSKALSSYEAALSLNEKILPPKHPDLAAFYDNIGLLHNVMSKYSKALSYHKRSLEIKKIALPPNHPDLVDSYDGIGFRGPSSCDSEILRIV
ncbi:unnamed protein product [Rotaria sp. Silwood1]|nr:unnamed protein product [Rotaria sp. Silwood1]